MTEEEGAIDKYSVDLPLVDFYAKHKGARLSGKPMAEALFVHMADCAHYYAHLQTGCKDAVMFLAVYDENSAAPVLTVGALTIERVLHPTHAHDPETAPLFEALRVQATLKTRNPPRFASITLHFFRKEDGLVSVLDNLVDIECRTCQKLGNKTCSGCHAAKYCSKECQDIHWAIGHKNACKYKK